MEMVCTINSEVAPVFCLFQGCTHTVEFWILPVKLNFILEDHLFVEWKGPDPQKSPW